MRTFNIAVIAGDGIGKEVVPEGIRVLDAAGKRFGFACKWHPFDWSCETYVKTGNMMPADGIQQLRPFDAIFLGAVGHPSVPDHVSLWGLLIPIRRSFQQYINLRPVRLFEGIETPLKNWKPGQIDFTIVRENNEGEYSNIGGRLYEGTDDEMAVQQTVFTRRGVNRVLRFAFELARKRNKHLTSATKSNGIIHTMPFWDECFHLWRHSFGSGSGRGRIDWHCPLRQSQSGKRTSIHVRTGARLSTRYCGERNRESDRPDMVGRHDAPPSGYSGGGGRN